MTKRIFDVVVASLGVALVALPLAVIAIAIKIDSRGPVFYRGERVGRNGRRFRIFKFRSMRADAEKDGPGWTTEADPRVTRIGRILRKTSLDEFPQFINVFLGHMSLVGPRPEQPAFVEQFRELVPRYMERHREKAGITGWAQINGLRGDTSISERTKYDLYYIENWSLWFDFKILILTALKFFRDRSAY